MGTGSSTRGSAGVPPTAEQHVEDLLRQSGAGRGQEGGRGRLGSGHASAAALDRICEVTTVVGAENIALVGLPATLP